jgi:hypothetical protein
VPYAIFESDWTRAPLDVQKNMNIFVLRCQRPFKITAMNLFYLSMETFLKVRKSHISFNNCFE